MSHPDRQQPDDQRKEPVREIIVDFDTLPRMSAEESRLMLLLAERFGSLLTWSEGPEGIEVRGSSGVVASGKDFYEILGIKRPEEMRQLLADGLQKLVDTLLKVREQFVALQSALQAHFDTPLPDGLEANPLKITLSTLLDTMVGTSTKLVKEKLEIIDIMVDLYRRKIALVPTLPVSQIELVEKALQKDQETTEHNERVFRSTLEQLLRHLTSVGIQIPMPQDGASQ